MSLDEEVSRVLTSIERAWLEGRPRDIAPLVDENVVTLVPGGHRVEGREALVQGFVDMCENARVHEFETSDRHVDAFGDVAVASVAFTMLYERGGEKYRATGRDVWMFARGTAGVRAVFRTMQDVAEEPVS